MWLPDVVIAAIGVYFFIQTLRENAVLPFAIRNQIKAELAWPLMKKREFDKAGFTQHELHGSVAGAPFSESGPEFAIVGKRN